MSAFSPATQILIIARAGQCCEVCGVWAEGGSIHHRRPKGMGGDKRPETNQASNGILVCGSGTTGCHSRIHNEPSWSKPAGLLLSKHTPAPAEIPAQLNRGVVYLDDAGNYLESVA